MKLTSLPESRPPSLCNKTLPFSQRHFHREGGRGEGEKAANGIAAAASAAAARRRRLQNDRNVSGC
jgi:hypothetical protein